MGIFFPLPWIAVFHVILMHISQSCCHERDLLNFKQRTQSLVNYPEPGRSVSTLWALQCHPNHQEEARNQQFSTGIKSLRDVLKLYSPAEQPRTALNTWKGQKPVIQMLDICTLSKCILPQVLWYTMETTQWTGWASRKYFSTTTFRSVLIVWMTLPCPSALFKNCTR